MKWLFRREINCRWTIRRKSVLIVFETLAIVAALRVCPRARKIEGKLLGYIPPRDDLIKLRRSGIEISNYEEQNFFAELFFYNFSSSLFPWPLTFLRKFKEMYFKYLCSQSWLEFWKIQFLEYRGSASSNFLKILQNPIFLDINLVSCVSILNAVSSSLSFS